MNSRENTREGHVQDLPLSPQPNVSNVNETTPLDHDITVVEKNQKGKEASESSLTGIYIDIHRRLEQMPTNDPIRTTLSTIGDGLAELIMLLAGFRGDALKFHSMVKESAILQKNIDIAKGEILKLKAELEAQKKLNDKRAVRVVELEEAAKAQSEQLEEITKAREQDKQEYELNVDNWKKRLEDSVSKARLRGTRMVALTLQMVREKLQELGLEEHAKHFENIDPLEEVRKAVEAVRKKREDAQKAGETSSKEMDPLAKKRKTTES